MISTLQGLDCCSDHSVSFHHLTGASLYMVEYFVYHLYPYGITRDPAQYEEAARLREAQRKV